jgi:hypothetical protein
LLKIKQKINYGFSYISPDIYKCKQCTLHASPSMNSMMLLENSRIYKFFISNRFDIK